MSGTLLLVDGLSLIYRAYHAIRDLNASDGRPTNAVYGFVRMWNQLVRQWKPTHGAVVFDGGLPETRLAALAEYKAQRPPMPEALRRQLPEIEQFVRCAGAKALRIEGQEADDVIATLSEQASSQGARVLIATNDKDLFQLVSENVAVVSSTKNGVAWGREEVLGKTGVSPEKIPEWLALTGDASDNIPGVPGVGEKTAAQWLRQFGSLDGLKQSINEIPSEKLRKALQENWAVVERNLEMVRLNKTLPLPVQWQELRLSEPVLGDLLRFYDHMEFRSLADEIRNREKPTSQLSLGF